MVAQRRLAIGLKHGQVDDLHWVTMEDGEPQLKPLNRRDPLRASRGILIAVSLAILMWVLALGAVGLAVLA